MGDRVKRLALWFLTACIVLGVIAGCGRKPDAPGRGISAQASPVREEESTEASDGQEDERAQASAVREEENTEASNGQEEENPEASASGEEENTEVPAVREDGAYTSKEEVAAYLHEFGRLPGNYLTKKEAEELGWDSRQGNLWDVAPGMSIGGSRFGNYEGLLPDQKGRKYFECDIDYEGGYRGAKRMIYSNDGLIFYTEDHYQTFEQLYGQEQLCSPGTGEQ